MNARLAILWQKQVKTKGRTEGKTDRNFDKKGDRNEVRKKTETSFVLAVSETCEFNPKIHLGIEG